jgi:hypothetical protein
MNRALAFLVVGLVVGGAAAYFMIDSGSLDTPRIRELEDRLARAEGDSASQKRESEKKATQMADLESAKNREIDALKLEIDALEHRLAESMEETDRLRKRLAESTESAPETDELIPATGFTDEQLTKELMSLGNNFQDLLIGTGEEFRKKMKAILARGGEGTVQRIVEMYEGTGDLGRKTVLAHALAQTGDPVALETLKATARNTEAGMFAVRTATHGLAFSDADGLETFYKEISENRNLELGARANSAYGLARRNDEGVEAYARTVDEAFRKKDPFAVAYLQGFMLLGERANGVVESRLRTIRDKQARLVLVEHLASNGNENSIPALRELANDQSVSEDIRKRAEQVANQLARKD